MRKLLLSLLVLAAFVAGTVTPVLNFTGFGLTTAYANDNQGDDDNQGDENDDQQ